MLVRMSRLGLLGATLTLAPCFATAKPKGSGLTTKEITDVIQANNGDARACYEKLLETENDAAGKVKIRFLIGLKGKIEASQIEQNTFKSKTLGNCLREKMKAWVFPKPREGEKVSIAYPFEFKTAEAPAAPPAPPASPAAPEAAPAAPQPPAEPASPSTPANPAQPTSPQG